MIVGAVETETRDEKSYPGRIRLSEISDYTAQTLGSFVESEVAGGSVVKTDGLPSYNNLPGTDHDKQVVGNQLAHNVLHWLHRIFSNIKAWEIGVYNGLRAKNLQSYLDELVFRFNRRRNRYAGLRSLLNLCGKACNGFPQRGGIGDQVDPPSFVVETPFHRATPFHQATTERPAGLICGEKIRAGPAAAPPNCRSVPQWVRI